MSSWHCQKYGKNAIPLPVDNYEELYDLAEGNFGLVTYAQAKAIGIPFENLIGGSKLFRRGCDRGIW